MLQVAQRSALRSRNPKALNVAMAKMHGVEEFCTREPHFEVEEVFGSQKRKANIPLESEHKSYRPDRGNFSHPQVQTRPSATTGASCSLNDILEEPSFNLQEHPILIDISKATHVITIQEIACKEIEWHTARLPKTLIKGCFAQQAITKKKCKAKIIQGNKATAIPTYIGIMVHYKKKTNEVMQFFFYNDDIKQIIKSTKWKQVKFKPYILNIWPMKIGSNFSRKKILNLEIVGFQLLQRIVISLRRLFEMEELPFDLSSYSIPTSPDDHSKTKSGKNIQRNKNASTTKHANNCMSFLTLKGHLRQVTMILHPRFGYIITLDFEVPPKVQQYMHLVLASMN